MKMRSTGRGSQAADDDMIAKWEGNDSSGDVCDITCPPSVTTISFDVSKAFFPFSPEKTPHQEEHIRRLSWICTHDVIGEYWDQGVADGKLDDEGQQ